MQKHARIKTMDGEGHNKKRHPRKYLEIQADIAGRDEATHNDRNPINGGQCEQVNRE
jgi:hypothetical protein